MRVLAVTNIYPTSTTPTRGTYVEQQIKSLKEIGFDVEIMLIDRLHSGMREYTKLPARLRTTIAKFQPDVVHAMYGGVMAAQVTQTVKDRPTLVTFHGSDLLGEHLSGIKRQLLASFGVWASYRAARQASGVIVVSKNLRDALPKTIPPNRINIIPCGIDLGRFRPMDSATCRDQLGWDASAFHILFPANNGDPVKRPALAEAAVNEVRNLGVRAELHYLQGVPYDKVPIWINASDMVLLTSLHEGSPTVVKEALACDVPVVSVDVGDVSERLYALNGCYVSAADPQILAGNIIRVYSGTRRVASRSSIEAFSLREIAYRVKQVYESVIRPSSKRVSLPTA